jgi:hypothetical protein
MVYEMSTTAVQRPIQKDGEGRSPSADPLILGDHVTFSNLT